MSNVIKLPALDNQIEIAPDWIAARDEIVAAAAVVKTIEHDADFRAAGDILRKLTKTSNAMEAFRKQYAEPYAEAVKIIKGAADTAREPLERAKARIQQALNRYAEEQQRKAEAERKRIEEEQRRAVEAQLAEQERARKEAEELGLDEPEPLEPVAPVAELPAVQAPHAEAVRVQTDVSWEVTDEERVDRAFMAVDPRKVNEWVRANKERIIEAIKEDAGQGAKLLAGIKLEVKTKVISR